VPPVAPFRVGVLSDLPRSAHQDLFAAAFRLGLDEVPAAASFAVPVEVTAVTAPGLPFGSADAVVEGFRALAAAGVLLVVGPAITDNALAVRPVADTLALPAINYAGGERTRSAWMFQYPIGSLEDEPAVLVARLARRGLCRVGVVFDESALGRRYVECFEAACAASPVAVCAVAAVRPTAVDVGPALDALRGAGAEALVYLGLGVSAYALGCALAGAGWSPPVVATSALMFGHARPEWTRVWAGWEYVDTLADDNRRRAALGRALRAAAANPGGCGAYDMGRLAGAAFAGAVAPTRPAVRDALERLHGLPAASGREGTRMGFGPGDRVGLKGEYLVLRTWVDGRSLEVTD
jgi:branched-chain amino acid transport system substrate-binding protein